MKSLKRNVYRWGASLTLVLTLLITFGSYGVTASSNLALNPDFESNPSPAYFSSFYPTNSTPTPSFSWATDASHSPSHSLKIVNPSKFNGLFSRWTFSTSQGVVAGHQYTASVWLKTQNVSSQALLNMRFFKSWSVAISGVSSTGVSGTSDWTQVSVTGTAPATTTMIYLEFMLYGRGTMWADDVYLADLSVGPVAPTNTTPPSISGTATAGSQLTSTTGTWSGSTPFTYSYQWRRCDNLGANCVDIAGATNSTYTPVSTDQGATVRSQVTASNIVGSATANSAATAVITAAPQNTSAPDVTGIAQDGNTLNLSNGSWTGTPAPSFSYQWQRCDSGGLNCTNIAGATSSSYQVNPPDVGLTLRGIVTAANSVGSATANSSLTAVVLAKPPSNTTLPTLNGQTEENQLISVTNGSWDGTPPLTYAYQWQRCDTSGANCVDISGANSQTYMLVQADVGNTVRAQVAAANTAGQATAASNPSAVISQAPIPPLNVGLPVVSGTTRDGQSLTTTTGSWDGTPPLTYFYQWQRCDASGANCSIISQATDSTYLLKAADVGSTIRSIITATNNSGNGQAFSESTPIINPLPPSSTALPIISGSAQTGQTLTVSNGTWQGTPPLSYAYQWQRCDGLGCSDISGANQSFYAIQNADLDYYISARVTASNSAGSASASSALVGPVLLYSPTLPKSIAALGDSISRAYGSDGSASDVLANSWATGTNTDVYSEYLRVLARDGSIFGHSGNYAQSGSKMAAVAAQADGAIAQGAEFVTVWSGTNDVCTATTAQMTSVSDYTAQIMVALNKISSSLPNARVLLVSIPNWYVLWQTYQSDTNAQTAWAFTNRCPDLLGSAASTEDRLVVNQRIIDLNNALAQVCSTFANCTYDNGAVYNLIFQTFDLAFDYFHLSATGQAKVAEALWQAGPYTNNSQPPLAQPPINTALPEITGEAKAGQTLNVSNGQWRSNAPITYSYEWQSCDADGQNCAIIEGKTQNWLQLTDADIGHKILAKVMATNAFGTSQATSQATAPIAGVAPVNTSVPTVTGTTEVGQVLSGSNGAWNGTQPITYGYQWQRCLGSAANCSNIAGATVINYLTTSADVNQNLRLQVTASNNLGNQTVSSSLTNAIFDPSATDQPNLSNFTEVKDVGCNGCSAVYEAASSTLTATIAGGNDSYDTAYGLADFGGASGWNERTYSRVDFSLSPGTTFSGNLAIFQERDISGNLIYELWLAGNSREICLYSPITWIACSGVVAPNDGTSVRLEVSAQANSSFIIRINGVDKITKTNLSGTTGPARYLRVGIDHYDTSTTNETVRVLHTNVGITTLGWLGDRTGPLVTPPANANLPQISGSTDVGGELTASDGEWSGTLPISYSYQWQRCDSGGAACNDIAGATSQTYTLVSADQGQTIRVRVTATNSFGSAAATSAPTALVTLSPPVNVNPPFVSGAAKSGGTLQVNSGNWAGSLPMNFSYQWQNCDKFGNACADIGGATSNSYLVTESDIGQSLKAVVTATNSGGTQTATSNTSAWVTNASVVAYNFARSVLSADGGQCSGCATENITVGDINADGRPDVVAGGKSKLLWYENIGNGASWQPHDVNSAWYGDGAAIEVADINNDGRSDIISGEITSTHQSVWFENTGSGWPKHTISSTIYCHDLTFADIDADQKVEAACADQRSSKVYLLKQAANPADPWTALIIDNQDAMGAQWADIDNDGQKDIISGRSWYKNPGDGSPNWIGHAYTNLSNNSMFDNYETLSLADLNGDGRVDILATMFAESLQGAVWVFLQPSDPTQLWLAAKIDNGPLFGVHSQELASFDGPTSAQFMVGESNYGGWNFGPNNDPQIYIYRLLGAADDPSAWQRTAIDNIGTHEASAADIDGDGKLDIVGHYENTDFMNPSQNGPVHWWKNNSQ